MSATNPWDNSAIILADRRGENIARGIDTAGEAMSRGIVHYGQNKMVAAQSVAKFEGAVQANPDLGQVLTSENASPEAAKAFRKLKTEGALGVRDATLLAGYAESYLSAKQQTQQQRLRDAQLKNEEALMVQRAAEFTQNDRNRAALGAALNGGITAEDVNRVLAMPVDRRFQSLPSPEPTADDALQVLQRYTRAGGAPTPEVVNLVSHLDANAARREAAAARQNGGAALQFVDDPVSGKRFATYGNQLQPSGRNPAIGGEGVQLVHIGAKKYFVGPGGHYFDENGTPVAFPSGRSNSPNAAVEEFLGGSSGGPSPTAGAAGGVSLVPGKTYQDKSGQRAKYLGNGKWQTL